MSSVVLDASAVLAFANGETGGEAVEKVRSNAVISAVNHAEVVSKLLQKDTPLNEITRFLDEVFPRVIPFDRAQAEGAGQLHAATRGRNLSYADCACVALARSQAVPVLTGDRKWKDIVTDVEIITIR